MNIETARSISASPITEEVMNFLKSLHLDTVGHAKASFYEHLTGVAALLHEWGNCDAICLAGLFHSIYGTEDFERQSLLYDERYKLQDLIGEESEYLAYLFSICDRKSFFLVLARIKTDSNFTIYTVEGRKPVSISKDTLVSLLEIEVANLLDQAPPVQDIPPTTRQTYIGMAMSLRNVVSQPASQAIQKYLLST